MKTAALMQPYFFPYIGYFHLISAADVFLHYDDVQYIEHGWSNRNRILIQGRAHTVTLPVKNAPKETAYAEREYCLDRTEKCVLRPIRMNYARAPQFTSVMPLIEEIASFPDPSVARFNANLIEKISGYLGLETEFKFASEVKTAPGLKAQDRVIAKVLGLGATRYVNASGGRALYSAPAFNAAGIDLKFVQSKLVQYPQYAGVQMIGLSIIDVLMFNSVKDIRENLWCWSLAS